MATLLEQQTMQLEVSIKLLKILATRVKQSIRLFQLLFGWLEQQDMRL